MYNLKIVDGDLAVQGNGDLVQISGPERIAQELSCWVLEPLGTDFIYPKFGSDLNEHIGSIMSQDELLEVRSEVTRLVRNYVTYQQRQISEANLSGLVNVWHDNDIVQRIDSIEVQNVADTIEVSVSLTTVGGDRVSVRQSL